MDDRSFYESIGTLNGWDFSRLNVVVEGEGWDFAEEVATRCRKTDLLLDIGTGGGEWIMPFGEKVALVVGIDRSSGMIETANRRASEQGNSRIRFHRMEADRLQFPDGFFDIVTARQAPIDAAEAARVLKPGGRFMTQQVGEADKLNLKLAFGRGQSWGVEDGTGMRAMAAELEAAGFAEVDVREYNADEYYGSAQDLAFLLTHPIIPDFGADESDYRILQSFIQANRRSKGIYTNSKRYRISAIKKNAAHSKL